MSIESEMEDYDAPTGKFAASIKLTGVSRDDFCSGRQCSISGSSLGRLFDDTIHA
jgi:hypothetical protein